MSSTVCSSIGRATDSLMRCVSNDYASNPLNGRELRRQAERNRRREAKKAKKAVKA